MKVHHNFTKVSDLIVGNYFIFHIAKGGKEYPKCKVLFMAYKQNKNEGCVIKPIAINKDGKELVTKAGHQLPKELILPANERDIDLPSMENVINIFGPEIENIIHESAYKFRNDLS